MNIVVGGTHGLGYEIVKLLRANNEKTFAVGRSYDKKTHGDGLAIDLLRDMDVLKLLEFVQQQTGPINFYWVAGRGYDGDFAEQEDIRSMIQVNFAAVMPIAQAAWRKMLESGSVCRFVVVASTTGVKARASEATYAATKHAQVGFTRSLGLEGERLNTKIKVALFLPGGMQTQFWPEDNRHPMYDEFLDPAKVAKKMLDSLSAQTDSYYEEMIERGSL